MIPQYTLNRLKKTCEDVWDIDDLHSKKKTDPYVFARHSYYYLLKNEYQLTELKIARLPQSRDRSTIYNSISAAEGLFLTRDIFRKRYSLIKELVNPHYEGN